MSSSVSSAMANGKFGVLVEVTPAIAEEFLKSNTCNRPKTDYAVSVYSRAMTDGQWGLSTDAIGFDVDGVLVNGQHRLYAVIDSGTTQFFYVVRNLPKTTFQHVDQHRKRTSGDALGLLGEANSNQLAAMVHRIYMIKSGSTVPTRERPSTASIIEFINEHPQIRQSAQFVSSLTGIKKIMTLSEAGALHYSFAQRHMEGANVFFEKLVAGTGLEFGDPIFTLRELLINAKAARKRIKELSFFACCIKAWNVYRSGGKLKIIRFHNEDFPVVR